MQVFYPEVWKKVIFDDKISENENFEVSNYGRIKSFKVDKEYGIIIKNSLFQGYPRVSLKQKSGKSTARCVHKLVAEAFIENDDPKRKEVIHLDYDRENNYVTNLKWSTRKESLKHQYAHSFYTENPENKVKYSKLNAGRVKMIKRMLLDPNRKTRIRILAKQFGVSEMQLYRIKSGENWGHVKID